MALSSLIYGTLLRRAATKTRRKAEGAAQAFHGLNAP